MKIRDMKISTQLRLGFGSILILVTALCAGTWQISQSLWKQTEHLYNHPFMVRRAITEIKSDIQAMHRNMEELHRLDNHREFQAVMQSIDTFEAQALREFAIVFERYLGPRSQVETAFQTFVQWKALRADSIQALRSGQHSDINTIYDTDETHANLLLNQLQQIIAFADNKANEFYRNAEAQRTTLQQTLFSLAGCIFFLITGILFYLQKSLRTPLIRLTDTAERFRKGGLDERISTHSTNEFGTLALAFNALADTVQSELHNKESQVQLAEIMLREEELSAFSRNVLTALMEHTDSQAGALYLLNNSETKYDLYQSIGLGIKDSVFAQNLHGEFNLAIFTGQIQRITNIPEDTRFALPSMTGTFLPREIITIPIHSGPTIIGILSLASVKPYSGHTMRLVNEMWAILSARLNALLLLTKLHEFTARLEQQNSELEEQKRELAAQGDELLEQNMELEVQTKQLDEANRLKSTFLSNMSHELRTPLNSVIALAGVLNRRLFKTIPEEEQSYLEMIERNGSQLLELINNILDLSRIEAGREDINPSIFSVQELISNVTSTLAPQASAKNIELRQEIAPDLPFMHTDFIKCRHIVQNLVSNAVKFTSVGHVLIKARMVDASLEISVSDTGIGILSDQIQYIFEEFRQGDESTTRNYGGTGLGLSIAKRYALMLNGTLSASSDPGKGATFTLRLPVHVESQDGTTSFRPATQVTPPRQGKGKRILLVEDSEPAIIQMTDILTSQGYRIAVARNGRQALQQIGAELPDAMILDLMMPEVDGFKVLESVRSLEASALLPVLILTAKHVTKEELSFLKGNHIHELIQKGDINKNDLLAAIASMVFPPAETRHHTPSPGITGTPNILIVEDNPDNRATMHALLKDLAVLSDAENGRIALEQIRAQRPDVVLMDISLPVMDGFACIAEIRKDEALRSLPVIAVTASAMVGDKEEILDRGFDAYVAKPVNFNLLVETIANVLAKRH